MAPKDNELHALAAGEAAGHGGGPAWMPYMPLTRSTLSPRTAPVGVRNPMLVALAVHLVSFSSRHGEPFPQRCGALRELGHRRGMSESLPWSALGGQGGVDGLGRP